MISFEVVGAEIPSVEEFGGLGGAIENSAVPGQLFAGMPDDDNVSGVEKRTVKGVNVLRGSDLNDFIKGISGKDIIFGREGKDRLIGQGGDDFIYGGDGGDYLSGGADDDILNGGAGNDTLFGSLGNDELDGGAGNDKLWGGSGEDVLDGGAGNDELDGGLGNDRFSDQQGENLAFGGSGHDVYEIGKVFTGKLKFEGEEGIDRLEAPQLDEIALAAMFQSGQISTASVEYVRVILEGTSNPKTITIEEFRARNKPSHLAKT